MGEPNPSKNTDTKTNRITTNGISPTGHTPNGTTTVDHRPVFFFDIDNCLYSRSKRVHNHMQALIDQYFTTHLSLPPSEATRLHATYYKQYGLALEGLVRHHQINPLEYNAQVDDALPLETILAPSPSLRTLLLALDRTKIKPWLFTNAYVNHGRRVVRLLGVDDCFEGVTFCDYAADRLVCKPHVEMFEKARREAGAGAAEMLPPGRGCYFVDDSGLNCRAAAGLGWTAVQLVEPGDDVEQVAGGEDGGCTIRRLEELRELFPQFFLKDAQSVDVTE